MLNTYINPNLPQGMVTWGTVGVGILTWFLLNVHGQIEEVWPHRCRMMKSQLSVLPSQKKLIKPGTQFWGISLDQRDDFFIPKDQYTDVDIQDIPTGKKITLKGRLYTLHAQIRPFMSKKTLKELYVYLSGVNQDQIDQTRLTPWFEFSKVYRHGIKLDQAMLTCQQKDPYLDMIDLASLLIRQDDIDWVPSLWQKNKLDSTF
jgi:hypothetical protein